MKALAAVCVFLLTLLCLAQQSDPATGAYLPAQAAADVIKEAAGADGAFLTAGDINPTYDSKDLASLINFPAETIDIVGLTGAEIKQAFERSVSLIPQSNNSFLQISGFTVEFKTSAKAGSRVTSIQAGSEPIQPTRTYKIAMSSGLAGGAMGYFKIWDKSKIAKTLDTTLEQALRGKAYAETSPRWLAR